MSGHGNGFGNPATFSTVRFDLATRLSILTALIYSGLDCPIEEALQKAVAINDLADSQAREMKPKR